MCFAQVDDSRIVEDTVGKLNVHVEAPLNVGMIKKQLSFLVVTDTSLTAAFGNEKFNVRRTAADFGWLHDALENSNPEVRNHCICNQPILMTVLFFALTLCVSLFITCFSLSFCFSISFNTLFLFSLDFRRFSALFRLFRAKRALHRLPMRTSSRSERGAITGFSSVLRATSKQSV